MDGLDDFIAEHMATYGLDLATEDRFALMDEARVQRAVPAEDYVHLRLAEMASRRSRSRLPFAMPSKSPELGMALSQVKMFEESIAEKRALVAAADPGEYRDTVERWLASDEAKLADWQRQARQAETGMVAPPPLG